tara:strand:- start:659 stop:946 length:288 start_codon:yes stop_codon:yes gene_type:complete
MTSLRSGVKLGLMKKLLVILVLGLLWCNIGLAEELSVNSLLQEGFKVSKEETIKSFESRRVIKIITLTKGKSQYAICTVIINSVGAISSTKCRMP